MDIIDTRDKVNSNLVSYFRIKTKELQKKQDIQKADNTKTAASLLKLAKRLLADSEESV